MYIFIHITFSRHSFLKIQLNLPKTQLNLLKNSIIEFLEPKNTAHIDVAVFIKFNALIFC